MQIDTGIITVIQMDVEGVRSASLDCPKSLIPGPGQYTLAHNPGEQDRALGRPLFPMGLQGSLEDINTPHLGPIPASWAPGSLLILQGPLGHGFRVPAISRRLALASLGGCLGFLLPLVHPALQLGADVAVFSSVSTHTNILPAAVEVHPLKALPEALTWAALILMEMPLSTLDNLRSMLKLGYYDRLPCQTQALIRTPMPCSSLAECGACAVRTRKKGYGLTCSDGPVFNLSELAW